MKILRHLYSIYNYKYIKEKGCSQEHPFSLPPFTNLVTHCAEHHCGGQYISQA